MLLIIIVLIINGCLKSQKQQSLKDYNHSVSEIARESDAQVSKPFFTALSGAAGKSAIDVQVQVNHLREEAQKLATRAKDLSVPGEMKGAQQNLLSTMNFRVEGITKIAALLPAALGGQGKQVDPKIAGDMEIFLASDVIYSQRVVPLIQESLSSNGIHASTQPSRFLPNLGWLDPTTVEARLTGKSTGAAGAVTSGTHGSSLVGTAVGTTTLAAGTDAQPRRRRRQPDVHGHGRKHRRKPGDERQGRSVRDGRRQTAHGLARDQLDAARQQGQRRNPDQRRTARASRRRSRSTSRRCRARRTPKTTRAPTWRSSANDERVGRRSMPAAGALASG